MPQTRDRLDRALAAWFAEPAKAHPRLMIAIDLLDVDQQDLLFTHLGPGTAREKAERLGVTRPVYYHRVACLKARIEGALQYLADARAA